MIPLRVKWYNPSPHSRRISPGDAARVRELSGQGYLPSAIAFELPHLTQNQIKYQIYGRRGGAHG